jgi:hypothetical protein
MVAFADEETHTCDGRFDLEQVWLGLENLGGLVEDIKDLVFSQAALAVEVVLEKCNVGLGWVDGARPTRLMSAGGRRVANATRGTALVAKEKGKEARTRRTARRLDGELQGLARP